MFWTVHPRKWVTLKMILSEVYRMLATSHRSFFPLRVIWTGGSGSTTDRTWDPGNLWQLSWESRVRGERGKEVGAGVRAGTRAPPQRALVGKPYIRKLLNWVTCQKVHPRIPDPSRAAPAQGQFPETASRGTAARDGRGSARVLRRHSLGNLQWDL